MKTGPTPRELAGRHGTNQKAERDGQEERSGPGQNNRLEPARQGTDSQAGNDEKQGGPRDHKPSSEEGERTPQAEEDPELEAPTGSELNAEEATTTHNEDQKEKEKQRGNERDAETVAS